MKMISDKMMNILPKVFTFGIFIGVFSALIYFVFVK